MTYPNVANRLNNLAGLLFQTDRLSKAEPTICHALAIFEKSLGKDHPNAVLLRKNLAALEAARNRGA